MAHIRLRLLVSGIAVAAILARYVFHIEIDGVAVGLLCLVFLPWVAPLIKSVEIPGVGKIEMQDLKEKAEEAQGAAQSASQKAELALASAVSESPNIHQRPMAADAAASSLERLAAEYNRLREALPSGTLRTSLMTKVVSEMIKIAPALESFDVAATLKQQNRGQRLSAYAFLYARPDWKFLDNLVSSVVEIEDKPFGQYWGILAIQRVIGSQAEQRVPEVVVRKLSALGKKLEPGTDRYYELKKVFELFGNH
jgi:hypothetical protein